MKLTFIELPQFTRLVTEVTDDRFLIQLQNTLIKNPEAGALIPRLHGLRKVRMALQGRSRSEGARVIYLHLKQHQAVIFFYLYTKAALSNLTPEQEKRLQAAVDLIKREYRHEDQGRGI